MRKFEKKESGVYLDRNTGKQWLWLEELGIWILYEKK